MFQSLELLTGQAVDLDLVVNNLIALHYQRVKKPFQEGEFSVRGGLLELYPAQFDSTVRVDFDDNRIRSIASVS